MRLIYFLLIGLSISVSGQMRYPTGVINVNTAVGGIVEQIQPDKAPALNALYLFENWVPATFIIRNDLGAFENPIRYDILNHQIEIKDGTALKVLEGNFIESLNFKSPRGDGENVFIITNNAFEQPTSYPIGAYEVLNEGDANLLKYYTFERFEAGYNPALDVGAKEPRLERKSEYYIMSNRVPTLLPTSKKKIIELLNSKYSGIKETIKSNRWNVKDEADLKQVVNYINNNM
ncbi:hypothetical protein [Ekhidna sp.]